MNSISNFINKLRHYDFLNITKSVVENQLAECKKPTTNWKEFGHKWGNICLYNIESTFAVGADVVAYLAISAFREMGLFLPLPPAPPVFPSPFDNTQFIHNAVERALWNWHPGLRKEMTEGIDEGLSDTFNVFQVVGEWALAYSFENAGKGDAYKPSFLKISEGLAGGETFMSVGLAFNKLGQKEQDKILNAIYRQENMPTLGAAGKKVYQDTRALASKLQQGNTIYFQAFGNYQKKKADGTLRNLVPALTVTHTVTPQPVVTPVIQNVYASIVPAATAPLANRQSDEARVLHEIQFFNKAVTDGLDPRAKSGIVKSIHNDRSPPLAAGNHPETLASCQPDASFKLFIARLCMLRMFKEGFQKNKTADCPRFFPWNESLRNGKQLRDVGQGFATLNDHEFSLLQRAIINPTGTQLSNHLRTKLMELSQFADMLHRNADFLRTYEALKIDLLAN